MVSGCLVHFDMAQSDLLGLKRLVHLLLSEEFDFQVETIINCYSQIFVIFYEWVSSVDLSYWVWRPPGTLEPSSG